MLIGRADRRARPAAQLAFNPRAGSGDLACKNRTCIANDNEPAVHGGLRNSHGIHIQFR